jgi:alpha/beta superfamily hydrolase
LIGLGLPVGDLVGDRGFSYLNACNKLKLLVNGEFDQYGPPYKLKALVEKLPPHVKTQTRLAIISGADHFFTGHLPKLDRTIAEWLMAQHPDLEDHQD